MLGRRQLEVDGRRLAARPRRIRHRTGHLQRASRARCAHRPGGGLQPILNGARRRPGRHLSASLGGRGHVVLAWLVLARRQHLLLEMQLAWRQLLPRRGLQSIGRHKSRQRKLILLELQLVGRQSGELPRGHGPLAGRRDAVRALLTRCRRHARRLERMLRARAGHVGRRTAHARRDDEGAAPLLPPRERDQPGPRRRRGQDRRGHLDRLPMLLARQRLERRQLLAFDGHRRRGARHCVVIGAVGVGGGAIGRDRVDLVLRELALALLGGLGGGHLDRHAREAPRLFRAGDAEEDALANATPAEGDERDERREYDQHVLQRLALHVEDVCRLQRELRDIFEEQAEEGDLPQVEHRLNT